MNLHKTRNCKRTLPRKRRLTAAIAALSFSLTPLQGLSQETDAAASTQTQQEALSEPAQQWLSFITQIRHLSQQS
ncbi:MAG: hypothetical protein CMN84_08335, partial [Spongiibacteraceae bacterium]|nr:hypothetical protein [Spongiibacteraceae bacterium]